MKSHSFLSQIGFYFGRRANFDAQNFMGFDQMELFQIKSGGSGVITGETAAPEKTSTLSSQTTDKTSF